MRVISIFYYKFLIEVWIVLTFLYKKKRLLTFDTTNFITGKSHAHIFIRARESAILHRNVLVSVVVFRQ